METSLTAEGGEEGGVVAISTEKKGGLDYNIIILIRGGARGARKFFWELDLISKIFSLLK